MCVEIGRPDRICKYLICGRARDSLDCIWKKRKQPLRLSVLHLLRRTQDFFLKTKTTLKPGWHELELKVSLSTVSKWNCQCLLCSWLQTLHRVLQFLQYLEGEKQLPWNLPCQHCILRGFLWSGKIPLFSERFESFLEVFNSHIFPSHQAELCFAIPCSLAGLDAEGRFMLEKIKDAADHIHSDSSKCVCGMGKWEVFGYDPLCLC